MTFLQALSTQTAEFSNWYKKGVSRAESLQSQLSIDAATITRELKVNRRDDNREPIAELGFQFTAWNGGTSTFSARLGAYSAHAQNAVVVSIGKSDELSDVAYRSILDEMIRAFEPDHAVVTSRERLVKAGVSKPWEAGLFTYNRGGPIVEHTFD